MLCSLGDVQLDEARQFLDANWDSENPELVFEFRHRSVAMLQALGIIPRPKRETPPVIIIEDEDDQPPQKRQKTGHEESLVRTAVEVRWLVYYNHVT